MVLVQIRAGYDKLFSTLFILNHDEEVLHKYHELDVGGLDALDVDEALLFILRVFKNMNSIFHGDTEKLYIFFKCGCHDITFLQLFRDLESFNFLEVVRLDDFFGGNVDLAHFEVFEDAHDLGVQEEEIYKL